MPQTQEMQVPTRAKAEEIAENLKLLKPEWTVTIEGSGPYTVIAIPPATSNKPAPTDNSRTPVDLDQTDKVRTGVLGFLDFISKYESNGNYNARFGASANVDDPEFVSMTLDQVLAWQEGRKYTAVGKYQIIRSTLSNLKDTLKLSGNAKFDAILQDRLGKELLELRGLKNFLAGNHSPEDFALSVSKEWAALPRVKPPYADQSYYAGVGPNKAHVTVAEYLQAIDTLKSTA